MAIYVVAGATGRVGSVVAAELIGRGETLEQSGEALVVSGLRFHVLGVHGTGVRVHGVVLFRRRLLGDEGGSGGEYE